MSPSCCVRLLGAASLVVAIGGSGCMSDVAEFSPRSKFLPNSTSFEASSDVLARPAEKAADLQRTSTDEMDSSAVAGAAGNSTAVSSADSSANTGEPQPEMFGFGSAASMPDMDAPQQAQSDTLKTPAGVTSPPGFPGLGGGTDSSSARRDSVRADTTRRDTTRRDSLLGAHRQFVISDTTYVVDTDSTYRLQQFVYARNDAPEVDLFPDRTYPLFASSHVSGYQRQVAVDSTSDSVRFSETLDGANLKVPVMIPLTDYIRMREKEEWRNMLAEQARKPGALIVRNDIGEVLSSFTKITIPVPANPLFSIFGKNEINLSVSGAVDIKAGFRTTKSDQTTLSVLDQTRSEPDFSQEVQVNVNGTIGDKLNILADWNTQRTFEYENQLKIKYTGYDDEIVQSVEAGNVSLSTPSSFIGSSQALFGVKARFQMGPLMLTTLASQKKGQIKEVAVTGGASEQVFQIHPSEYATNHYFVDLSYRSGYETFYQTEPPRVDLSKQILEAEVWVTQTGIVPDPNARQGIAFIDLPPYNPGIPGGYDTTQLKTQPVPGQVETGRFIKLDPSQYEMDANGAVGVLSLNTSVSDDQIIAIAYRTQGNQWGEFYRNIVDTSAVSRVILKLVKPRSLLSVGPVYPTAWKMLLKNIYAIPGVGRNLKQTGFTLDVVRTNPGSQDQNSILGEPLLRVLGVDKYLPDGTPAQNGDGQFDFRAGRTINQERAEVVFPYLAPFDTGIISYFKAKGGTQPDSSFFFPEVYDTTVTFAAQSQNNRYVIEGKATGDVSSRFSLGFNVVEGSVQVILNGAPLTPNVDYSVDYIVGEVVIKNAAALVPGANLQIKFEQNDLFQLASKTLLGARGDLFITPTTTLGFTIMNLNQQTLSDKVRLGEEPSNNTIVGLDGSTTIDLPILTRALDALPLIQTHESSSLKLSGEIAEMLPNANTKASTIASDNSQGVAYIDDFEGARQTTPVGISYAMWTQASPPADSASNVQFGQADSSKMNSKAKLIWFNRLPTNVLLTDIYPNKSVTAANNQATVLDLRYFPLVRGQYNYSGNLSQTLTPAKNWGGVMKTLSVSAINLLQQNINSIEIWMRVDRTPSDGTGKMLIDLGAISERVDPNGLIALDPTAAGLPNSESYVFNRTSPSAVVLDGADKGIDMMNDQEEQAKWGKDRSDPSGDDYAYSNTALPADATFDQVTSTYWSINGSEGNLNGPTGRIPDTEDLNNNGQCDQVNSYFEYELPLDTVAATNPYIVGGGNAHWFEYRIPIRQFVRMIGNPSQENIEYIRVLFVNATDTVSVRIADFNLVGSQWQKVQGTEDDSSFSLNVVSVETNKNYNSPPGVQRERDLTQPTANILSNEQSLVLGLNGLPDGESRQAVKYYTYKPLDVFNYHTMKMFVHTDENFAYHDTSNYDAEVFFRFGVDSANYYEYRAPLRPDPGNGDWSEVSIQFSELTAIKLGRDSINVLSPPRPVSGGPPGATYRVLGNPSLTGIVYLSLGVTNPLHKGTSAPLHGEVWFDELRLIDVDNTKGVAYRFDTQLKLADLGSVSFNYSKVDPNFHTLDQQFGSRQTGINWGMAATMQLERLFPEEWAGTSIPVSYSHSFSLVTPEYLPGSDILVSEAAALTRQDSLTGGSSQAAADAAAAELMYETQTKRVTDTYAVPAFRINFPSNAWFIRDTFNKLTYGFNYTKSSERSPMVVMNTAWSWTARMSYALVFNTDYYIVPFRRLFDGIWFLDEYKGLKLYYSPVNFSWSFSATRSRANSLQRTVDAQEIISRNFSASRQFSFSWKLTEGGIVNPSGDYSLSVESSLLDFELNQFQQQRSFSQILNDIFFRDKFINFGQDTRYSQHTGFNTKPDIPNIFGIKKYVNFTFAYSADYAWQNSLTGGDLGKSVGFTNSITTSATVRLKSMFDPLFETGPTNAPPPAVQERGGRRGREEAPPPSKTDTTHSVDTTRKGPSGPNKTLAQLKSLFKVLIKAPLLDYDNVNISFSQTNSAQNNGIIGRPGFVNFWGKVPFLQESDPNDGPSRLYQLGLISDPTGRLTNFHLQPTLPFFGWDVEPGPRASGGNLLNTYRETNHLSFKTSRALWEGARIDLNWNVGWSYSRSQNLTTDSLSNIPVVQSASSNGSVDRSFLTFPDFLFFSMFKTSLKDVSKRFAELNSLDTSNTPQSRQKNLSQAFEQGFEAFPVLRKVFGQYMPRVNWSFRWDGLEKMPLFEKWVSRLSLDHSYTSDYTRQFENTWGGGGEQTDAQRVSYSFSPLIGANFTFKELSKGNFGANIRYNTSTSYDLSASSQNLVETLTEEFSLTASYSRKGFEIPLFGLSLNNDIDISLSYSVRKNSQKTYDVTQLDVSVDGIPMEGSTTTTIEPTIKYVLSQRVQASIYYRYTKQEPDLAGSRIPGSTMNEAGLNIHIAIQ